MSKKITTERTETAKAKLKELKVDIPEQGDMSDEDYALFLADVASEHRAKANEAKKVEPTSGDGFTGKHFDEKPSGDEVKELLLAMKAQLDEERLARKKMEAELDTLREQRISAGVSPMSLTNDPAFIKMMQVVMDRKEKAPGIMRSQYIDPQDRMDKPAIFFCNRKFGTLRSRSEGGYEIAPPDGFDGVKFKDLFRFVDPQTLKMDYRGLFETESKALAEWIRRHHKFGTEIFESEEELQNMSERSDWADMRDRMLITLNQRTDNQVSQLAGDMGIKFSHNTDYKTLRRKVAEEMTNKEFAELEAARVQFNKERKAQELLVREVAAR